MAKNNEHKTKDLPRTTIRIIELQAVKLYYISKGFSSLKEYLNHLIGDDILKNGDEEIVKKYFKRGS